MRRLIIVIVYVFAFAGYISAQGSSALANNYYKNGEYEKAADLYEYLFMRNLHNNSYFTYYYNSLIYSDRYEEALKAIDKYQKAKPHSLYLYVMKGDVYEKLNDTLKANKYYHKAIDKITNQQYEVIKIADAFVNLTKYDLALEAYKKGLEVVDNKVVFLYKMGELYELLGDNEKKLHYYSAYFRQMNEKSVSPFIKSKLAKSLSKEEINIIKEKLIEDIQEQPDNLALVDMLSWAYLQLDQYDKAYRQVTALDRRFKENGTPVYKFAIDAKKSGNYEIAAKAFKYIVDNKGKKSPYFLTSVNRYLQLSTIILDRDTSTTQKDYIELENLYNDFLKKLGTRNVTANLVYDLAKLKALKLHNVDDAISTLEDFISAKYIDSQYKAKAKLLLGDFYLLKDEIWESSLLFSQVDKDFTEGELGELSRYKNAKLYYYNGDFEWAQIIFNILKPATSRLISNDAIESSVFISETIGEDSTMIEPLKMFAKAELLIYQNKYDKALSSLDSINFLFPKNNLEDDIWYQKAQVFKKMKRYNLAIKMYNQIIEKYPEELKADNAIFELALLYEKTLKDKKTAIDLYKKLFLEYDSSTLAVEARKKYRELSEDSIQ